MAAAVRARWIAALLVVGALLGGCHRDRGAPERPSVHEVAAPVTSTAPTAPHGGFPVVVRDDLGRDVEIAVEPRRIVALLPSHTETLFALGLGDRVVGVDDYSDFPAEVSRLPKLGGLYDVPVERIVALAPDLVLVSESGRAAEALTAAGLHAWAGSARRLDDVYRVIEAVGRLAGRSGEAAALASSIRGEIEAIEAPLRTLPRVRVYYELDAMPYTVGPGSFIGALLAKAGGENIVPETLGDYPRISPELVIARDPEVIMGVSLEDARRRPGWSAIRAVRAARVDALTPAERVVVARPGPRLGQSLRVFARRLHPELGL